MYLAHLNDSYHMDTGDWGFGFLMMLIWALFVTGIVILAVKGTAASSNRQNKDDDSLTIAKNRYAKGEITKKEFDQLTKDLSSK